MEEYGHCHITFASHMFLETSSIKITHIDSVLLNLIMSMIGKIILILSWPII